MNPENVMPILFFHNNPYLLSIERERAISILSNALWYADAYALPELTG